jgi:DNA-binding LytR/AlgR family response regulator
MSTNILVVEDESIVRKDIERSLQKLGYNVVGTADTGEKAIELALTLKPDIALMDIMLKGEMTGIEAAEEIRSNIDIPIIYLTAYADESTLAKAKVTEPHGYILKPFKEVDIHTTIEMALHKHKKEREIKIENELLRSLQEYKAEAKYIFVKSKSRLVRLHEEDLLFVEALKDYVTIHTRHEKYTIHATMKDIEKKLSGPSFVRVHRSFIVNLNCVSAIQQNGILIEGHEEEIPIGGSHRDTFASHINIL